MPKKPAIKPQVPLRQLHWGKMPDAKVVGTLWEKDVSDDKVKLDVSEIEELFAASSNTKLKSEPGEGADEAEQSSRTPRDSVRSTKRVETVTLLDAKTANNTAIAISRFRMSPESIAHALEVGSDGLTADQLSSLASILPSADDVQLVQEYEGPTSLLGKAESFVLAVSKVPRYAIRVRCMLTRATFDEKYEELRENLEAVVNATTQVRKSATLRRSLEVTLAVGNYLNGSTSKGGAWGFRLDTLSKIASTKTLDGRSTLLHYLARLLDKPGAGAQKEGEPPADEGDVAAPLLLLREMPHIEAAARLSWKDEVAELTALSAALNVVATQLKQDQVADFKVGMGAFHDKASKKLKALMDTKEIADKQFAELVSWFGEDPKMQPEELFGMVHNFALTLDKAHKYNQEREEEEARKLRNEEAAQKRQTLRMSRAPSRKSELPDSSLDDGDDSERTPRKSRLPDILAEEPESKRACAEEEEQSSRGMPPGSAPQQTENNYGSNGVLSGLKSALRGARDRAKSRGNEQQELDFELAAKLGRRADMINSEEKAGKGRDRTFTLSRERGWSRAAKEQGAPRPVKKQGKSRTWLVSWDKSREERSPSVESEGGWTSSAVSDASGHYSGKEERSQEEEAAAARAAAEARAALEAMAQVASSSMKSSATKSSPKHSISGT